MSSLVLLNNVITAPFAGVSENIQRLRTPTDNKTFQATGRTTAGIGAVSVEVQVSNDNANWIVMGTITLTLGTATTTDGFVSIANWTYVRGRVASLSGTGATVSLFMGL
jgi:hypothetical protein